MRVVRAFRLPITAIITALALSGCMRTTGPVAVAPQGDLDSMAYGAARAAAAGGRGRFRRRRHRRASRGLRRSTARAGTRRRCRTRGLCRTDAGAIRLVLSSRCRRQAARRGLRPGRPDQYLRDRRRRLDHDAADRFGAGARPYPAGLGGGDIGETARRLHPGSRRSRWRSRRIGRSSFSARSPPPGNIRTYRT